MQTYIILSRLSPDALKDPRIYREMADKVSNRIKQECPDVHWQKSFAVLGALMWWTSGHSCLILFETLSAISR